ncbi:MAG: hypothetical protein KDA60_16815, partial [Planctomycetales bacterium]|nr:hypothetical protein [Planctomycetales bacterium]
MAWRDRKWQLVNSLRADRFFCLVIALIAFIGSEAERSTLEGAPIQATSHPVAFDRWMYPFNSTPGTRSRGTTFGAIGDEGFDNRDSQILIGFDTSSIIAPGEAPAAYSVTELTLRLFTEEDQSFQYDPTMDPWETYAGTNDPDPGRPIELMGVATRGDYLRVGLDSMVGPPIFGETDPFSADPFGDYREGTRFAFASDYFQGDPRDVSNNVTEQYTPNVWATGHANLVPGTWVPANTEMSFAIDVANTDAVRYIQQG